MCFQKILSLTGAWDSLNDSNTLLKNQVRFAVRIQFLLLLVSYESIPNQKISQLEEQLQHDQGDELNRLTAEFTERIGSLEARYRDACKERDALRTQVQEVCLFV